MEIIFHSHANKTRFHKKGCAPSLILKVRGFGTRKWPINFSFIDSIFLFLVVVVVVVFPLFFFWEKNVLLLITNLVRLVSRTSVWTTFILDSLFMPGSIWPVTMLPARPYSPGEFAIFFSFPVVYSPPPSSMIDLIYVFLCKSFLEQ